MRVLLVLLIAVATGCAAHSQRVAGPRNVTRMWIPLGVPDEAELCIADPVERRWDCRTVQEWRAIAHAQKNVSNIRYGYLP